MTEKSSFSRYLPQYRIAAPELSSMRSQVTLPASTIVLTLAMSSGLSLTTLIPVCAVNGTSQAAFKAS